MQSCKNMKKRELKEKLLQILDTEKINNGFKDESKEDLTKIMRLRAQIEILLR